MLKILGRKTSVNVQKAMWTVGELGLLHERVDLGGEFGGLDTAEYIALNPNKLVPTLDDGGFTLWESNSIIRYLSRTYGHGTLAPADPHAYGRAEAWMDWSLTSLYADVILTCFIQHVRVAAKDRDVAAVAAAAKRAGDKLAILDAHLAGCAFIMGDQFTMADIAVGTLMYRYFNLPIARPPLANVEAWYARLSKRPAYQTHVMIDYKPLMVAGA